MEKHIVKLWLIVLYRNYRICDMLRHDMKLSNKCGPTKPTLVCQSWIRELNKAFDTREESLIDSTIQKMVKFNPVAISYSYHVHDSSGYIPYYRLARGMYSKPNKYQLKLSSKP